MDSWGVLVLAVAGAAYAENGGRTQAHPFPVIQNTPNPLIIHNPYLYIARYTSIYIYTYIYIYESLYIGAVFIVAGLGVFSIRRKKLVDEFRPARRSRTNGHLGFWKRAKGCT